MKSAKSLARSARSAINQAVDEAHELWVIASELESVITPKEIADLMPKARERLALLTQRLHEFSAYHNALHTS